MNTPVIIHSQSRGVRVMMCIRGLASRKIVTKRCLRIRANYPAADPTLRHEWSKVGWQCSGGTPDFDSLGSHEFLDELTCRWSGGQFIYASVTSDQSCDIIAMGTSQICACACGEAGSPYARKRQPQKILNPDM